MLIQLFEWYLLKAMLKEYCSDCYFRLKHVKSWPLYQGSTSTGIPICTSRLRYF